MIDFLSVSLCILGILFTINFLFALLYILSKTAGNGLYRWVTMDYEFLALFAFPFFGLTELVASEVYARYNWFIARVVLFGYILIVMVLIVVCFMLFDYFVAML